VEVIGGQADVQIVGGGPPAIPAKPGTVDVAATLLSNDIDLSDDTGRTHVAFGAEELSRSSIFDPQGSLSGASFDTGGEAAGNELFYNSKAFEGVGVLGEAPLAQP